MSFIITMRDICFFVCTDWVWNGKSFVQVSKEWKMVRVSWHTLS